MAPRACVGKTQGAVSGEGGAPSGAGALPSEEGRAAPPTAARDFASQLLSYVAVKATHVLFRTRDGGPGLFVVLVASGLLRQVDAARLRTYLPEYVVLALERLQQQQEATAPEAVLALESLAESLLAFVGLRVLSLPDLRSMLLSVVEHEPTRERLMADVLAVLHYLHPSERAALGSEEEQRLFAPSSARTVGALPQRRQTPTSSPVSPPSSPSPEPEPAPMLQVEARNEPADTGLQAASAGQPAVVPSAHSSLPSSEQGSSSSSSSSSSAPNDLPSVALIEDGGDDNSRDPSPAQPLTGSSNARRRKERRQVLKAAKKREVDELWAVPRLQRMARAFLLRRRLAARIERRRLATCQRAATVLQSAARACLARRLCRRLAEQRRQEEAVLEAGLLSLLHDQAVPLVHGSASSRDPTKALARALLSSTLPAALATACLPLFVRALPRALSRLATFLPFHQQQQQQSAAQRDVAPRAVAVLLMPLLLGRTDAKRLLPVLEASLTEALGETHAVAAHMVRHYTLSLLKAMPARLDPIYREALRVLAPPDADRSGCVSEALALAQAIMGASHKQQAEEARRSRCKRMTRATSAMQSGEPALPSHQQHCESPSERPVEGRDQHQQPRPTDLSFTASGPENAANKTSASRKKKKGGKKGPSQQRHSQPQQPTAQPDALSPPPSAQPSAQPDAQAELPAPLPCPEPGLTLNDQEQQQQQEAVSQADESGPLLRPEPDLWVHDLQNHEEEEEAVRSEADESGVPLQAMVLSVTLAVDLSQRQGPEPAAVVTPQEVVAWKPAHSSTAGGFQQQEPAPQQHQSQEQQQAPAPQPQEPLEEVGEGFSPAEKEWVAAIVSSELLAPEAKVQEQLAEQQDHAIYERVQESCMQHEKDYFEPGQPTLAYLDMVYRQQRRRRAQQAHMVPSLAAWQAVTHFDKTQLMLLQDQRGSGMQALAVLASTYARELARLNVVLAGLLVLHNPEARSAMLADVATTGPTKLPWQYKALSSYPDKSHLRVSLKHHLVSQQLEAPYLESHDPWTSSLQLADEAFDHLGTPSARFHVDREYLLQVVEGILEPEEEALVRELDRLIVGGGLQAPDNFWSNTKYTASDLLLCLSEQEKDRQSHLEQEEEKLSLELQQKEMELQKLKDEGKLTEEQRSRSVLAKLEDLERKRARVYEGLAHAVAGEVAELQARLALSFGELVWVRAQLRFLDDYVQRPGVDVAIPDLPLPVPYKALGLQSAATTAIGVATAARPLATEFNVEHALRKAQRAAGAPLPREAKEQLRQRLGPNFQHVTSCARVLQDPVLRVVVDYFHYCELTGGPV